MATRKLNARSPYFITSSGTVTSSETVSETEEVVIEDENILLSLKIVQINDDGTTNDVLGSGVSEQDITLRASGNFTPANNLYTWTASSGTSLGTSVDATFTEDISTITPSVTQKQFSYTVSAITSDGTTVTSPPFNVNWRDSSITPYNAKLTIANNILPSYSSPGYDLSITYNATNQDAITQSTSAGTLGKAKQIIKEVTGQTGDSYSFFYYLNKKDGFTDTASPLTVSTSSFSGTFASANVNLSSTLSGTVVRDATYILSSNTDVTTEGCPFTITLSTTNIPDIHLYLSLLVELLQMI